MHGKLISLPDAFIFSHDKVFPPTDRYYLLQPLFTKLGKEVKNICHAPRTLIGVFAVSLYFGARQSSKLVLGTLVKQLLPIFIFYTLNFFPTLHGAPC